MIEARRIYQDTLDRMTAALLSRDPAAFTRHVFHPYEVRTVDGVLISRTESETEQMVTSFADQLAAQKVTRYERVCDAAQFVNPDHISGYHTSRAWCGDGTELDPFLTRLSLYRTEDTWKVATSDTALRTNDWTLLPAWFRTQDRRATVRAASDSDQKLHLFQTILDRISAAFLSGDAEAWVQSLSLPCQLVTRQGVESFDTPEQVRADFELYQREFEIHGITDIIREAKTAQVIDDDQMVGTYATHILRGATHVVPPWDASMTLRRENGLWRVTTVMRAIGHLNWSALSPADIEDIPQDTPTKGETQ